METMTLAHVVEQLELGETLFVGRAVMFEPQDLPGRFGRVVAAVDHLLRVLNCPAVVGGGWAVWRHGYVGRLTRDLDIVLAADRIDEFLRVASVSGFDVLPIRPGRWPKLTHRETGIQVDILPEGARPGTTSRPAPTTIPSPATWHAASSRLTYMPLSALVELKLAAGRAKDDADVVELIRANPDKSSEVREHLVTVHPSYVAGFDRLAQQSNETDEAT
jgi:hypothetical protein